MSLQKHDHSNRKNKVEIKAKTKTENKAESKAESKMENAKNKVNRIRKDNRNRKGVKEMSICEVKNGLFEKDIIGFRELREKISEVIDSVINHYKIFESGNIKRNTANTASIISTQLLIDILKIYEFKPVINKDEATNQFEIILDEIGIYSCGETMDEAINMLVDLVLESTVEYFENIDMYARIPEQRKKYSYYLRISKCEDKSELLEVLNLKV